jgi:hypothetical protein
MRPRKIAGLLLLGAFAYLWLALADAATGGCDDACSVFGGWSEQADSPQWTTQLWLARAGVAATVAGTALWLLRRRRLAAVAIAAAVVLFCLWYPIAEKARFGPPGLGSAPTGARA